ncbi:proline dehydrogenase family protein [Evansella sp. AB-P1]|uniref:proline dehydrogenase family protein n=1 Tax=Evansella sp. AB-P1 TaxID=3037653 RepID=UPI00241D1A24|nr:proline dehydrogenase family protein [Evansella sp. AB-P1]MDG5787955.1 proline dehydrogenase family protein [Evansella sp. AB-P1]
MITRNFFLYLSNNKLLKKKAMKWGPKLGASQVIAGVSIPEAMEVVGQLNEKGLVCTVDHLGEFVYNQGEAIEAANQCIRTLEAIENTKVHCNLSLKLTSLGLDIDKKICLDNMIRIVRTAKKYNNFVRIDMEDYEHLNDTLEILLELRESFDNVGTAIQAYLFRSEEDIHKLRGTNIRLIKGAYKESPEVAFRKQEDIDQNFINIIKTHLMNGSYGAIATHDHKIIDQVKAFTKEQGISKDQFEFQMLYGFRTELQQQIANEGYKMRIYVPFGEDWYGYFMRRLAERPQNVRFALRGLYSK